MPDKCSPFASSKTARDASVALGEAHPQAFQKESQRPDRFLPKRTGPILFRRGRDQTPRSLSIFGTIVGPRRGQDFLSRAAAG